MRASTSLLYLAFVAMALPAVAGQRVGLTGRILDETGAAVAGASVVATGSATGARRETSSDEHGRYELAGLPADRYHVTVRSAGFSDAIRDDVVLAADQLAALDVTLRVAGFEQQIQVTSSATLALSAASRIDVKPAEVRGAAGAGENIFRVLQTLPELPRPATFRVA